MTRKILAGAALLAAISLGACEKQLTVTNPNQGETGRVLGTPNDAEALIGTYYKRWSVGIYSSTDDLQGMANNFSMMNYASLANSCQNSHLPFTGAINANTPGNVCQSGQKRLYFYMGEVNRVASSLLGQMDAGLSLGSTARNARARSWANFLNGLALGYTALMHDSGAVITPESGPEDAGVLIGHLELADSSAAYFQRAIDEATKAVSGGQGFPIPSTWFPTATSMTVAEFVKVIRSYRARIMANVARTPAERAGRNWTAITADAAAGITADHLLVASTTLGPGQAWRSTYNGGGLWHQIPAFFIGMADTSGTYAAWIAQPVANRGAGSQGFFLATPDLRFPQGDTRAAQQADFARSSCDGASKVCKRYYLNRFTSADNNTGDGWGLSNYDMARFNSWAKKGDAGSARNGKTTYMDFAEIDLIRAEGLYRAGDYAGAGAIVNKTRTKNGLPAITTFNATSAVPGGNACVPKVPSGSTISCGNLWEALKYEKRIETAYTAYSNWYLDNRGWGDLSQDIPLFWAVPYQDMQSRGTPLAALYGAGPGVGNAPSSTAAKSAYGW
ncbi:MAG: hypothetical protein O2973_09245 [Gemmatimonadetes bacterium]|nr:hypothetical protein [Gemmatimonadota bacterium]